MDKVKVADNKVNLIYVSDPFDPLGSRKICQVDPNQSVRECLQTFFMVPKIKDDYELHVKVNENFIEDLDLIVKENDYVYFLVVPKGDNFGRIFAMIIVLIISIWAPGAAGFAYGSMAGSMLSAGIMIAGGLIVNAMFPPVVPKIGSGSDTSPTYGWAPPQNKIYEGGIVPVLYGEHRVTPYLISRYTDIKDGHEYLNMLFLLADHEISKVGEAIGFTGEKHPLYVKDVKIQDTALTSFHGVHYEVRHGSLDQQPISGFNKIRHTNIVGAGGMKIVDNTWIEYSTVGNVINQFGLIFSMPSGFYKFTDKGRQRTISVHLAVEYQKKGTATWNRLHWIAESNMTYVEYRWSLGYWVTSTLHNQGFINTRRTWRELVAGSTNPNDHQEGDYVSGEEWCTGSVALGCEEETNRYTWRWIYSENVAERGDSIPYFIITSGARGAQRRSFYSPLFENSAGYNIRVRADHWKVDREIEPYTSAPTGIMYASDLYIESVEEIEKGDDFSYPGTALLAVRALATEHLSGAMPRISCVIKREFVKVWNPHTNQYEDQKADNPAWACYDVLHNSHYGAGFRKENFIYDDFKDWADWCDETLEELAEEEWCSTHLPNWEEIKTLPKYQVNYYLDQELNAKEVCDAIGLLGRGTVRQIGSKLSCIVERPEIPTQRFLFTVGNMSKDSFSQEFLPMENRCNCIDVTYWDESTDYNREIIEIQSEALNPNTDQIKTSIQLPGCNRRDMAIRHGIFLLNSTRYLTITASWEASIDSIHCLPGDIVEVQHDVPVWGFGGRVISATANTITLDREITIHAGESYAVTVKYNDDTRDTKDVASVAPGKYKELPIVGSWAVIPEELCLYSFGLVEKTTQLMRILTITRASDYKRKITAIEHIDEIYDDCAIISEYEPISDLEQDAIRSIRHIELWDDEKKGVISRVSWDGSGPEFIVEGRYYLEAEGVWSGWASLGVTRDRHIDFPNLPQGLVGEVSVRSNILISNIETVQFTHTGIVESAVIDLDDLIDPKIYFNVNADGSVTHARFECTLDANTTEVPDGIILFYSVDALPNKLSHLWVGFPKPDSTFEMIGVHLQEEEILRLYPEEGEEYPVVVGTVDANTLRITTADQPIGGESGGGSLDGSFWVVVARPGGTWTKWNQVHHYTDTDLVFKDPFYTHDSPWNNLQIFTPQAGDIWAFGQIRWKDIRELEWKLGFVYPVDAEGDPVSHEYEIIRYRTLLHDTFDTETDYWYLENVQREREGTSKIDIGNPNICSMYYYPAPGPGTHMVILEANKFVHVGQTDEDYVFAADTNLNIPILTDMWGAITCCTYKIVAATDENITGLRRSNIIPVSYGGGL